MNNNDAARSFLESVAGYSDAPQGETPSQDRPVKMGTVDPAFAGGNPKVLFDGETVMGVRTYPWVGRAPLPGERVVLLPQGHSYVIVGTPGVSSVLWTSITGGPEAYPMIPADHARFIPSASYLTYPLGSSITIVEPDAGWPVAGVYGNLRTHKIHGAGGGTLQEWSIYNGTDTSIYYRQWLFQATAWTAWQKLAVAGKDGIPFAMAAGTVAGVAVAAGGSNATTVTFPAGRFSVPPIVSVTKTVDFVDITVGYATVTATSFTLYRGSAGVARTGVTASWTATQMASGAAAG